MILERREEVSLALQFLKRLIQKEIQVIDALIHMIVERRTLRQIKNETRERGEAPLYKSEKIIQTLCRIGIPVGIYCLSLGN